MGRAQFSTSASPERAHTRLGPFCDAIDLKSHKATNRRPPFLPIYRNFNTNPEIPLPICKRTIPALKKNRKKRKKRENHNHSTFPNPAWGIPHPPAEPPCRFLCRRNIRLLQYTIFRI